MKFNENLVIANCGAASAEEVITALCRLLEQEDMVKPTYLGAVLAREVEYPTGVPTAYFDVAIPHAPSDHVLEAGFAIAKLQNPVTFGSMGGDEDEKVEAKLVFLLAVKDPQAQIQMLRALMRAFENEEAMNSLLAAEDAAAVCSVVHDLGLA